MILFVNSLILEDVLCPEPSRDNPIIKPIGQTTNELEALARLLAARLADELREGGWLRDPKLELAFREVLRHHFIPQFDHLGLLRRPPWREDELRIIYQNRVLALKRSATGRLISSSSEPAIMAVMLEALRLEEGSRVLEVGTGSGWNAALIAHRIGPRGLVVSLDLERELQDHARQALARYGFDHVVLINRDGHLGAAEYAPYDRLIVTAAARGITRPWYEQMAEGGVMVVPVEIEPSNSPVYRFYKVSQVIEGELISFASFLPMEPRSEVEFVASARAIGRLGWRLGQRFVIEPPLRGLIN